MWAITSITDKPAVVYSAVQKDDSHGTFVNPDVIGNTRVRNDGNGLNYKELLATSRTNVAGCRRYLKRYYHEEIELAKVVDDDGKPSDCPEQKILLLDPSVEGDITIKTWVANQEKIVPGMTLNSKQRKKQRIYTYTTICARHSQDKKDNSFFEGCNKIGLHHIVSKSYNTRRSDFGYMWTAGRRTKTREYKRKSRSTQNFVRNSVPWEVHISRMLSHNKS
jgi:hypothetical protein